MTRKQARRLSRGTFAALVALFALLVTPALAVTIDTVPVGSPSNSNDPSDGDFETPGVQNFGAVAYNYQIGKYEVTVGQYTAFLNAVAATDTYSLYNTNMATDLNIAGIQRSGASGSYTYSVIGSATHPVTYVSWGDAARFANWMNNNQPTGAQGPGTTEDGAYTLNGATSNEALNAVTRSPGAAWFIPTENEWYKAAYYQPAAQGGDTDNYWLSPTKTNSTSYSDQPPGTGAPTPSNTANYPRNDGAANGYNDGYAVTGLDSLSSSQNYLTDVGAYTGAASYYGTYDQGGNVFEWNEAFVFTGPFSPTYRGARGGSWASGFSEELQVSVRGFSDPSSEYATLGFRMATVPEPSTAVLAMVGCVLMLWWRKKRK